MQQTSQKQAVFCESILEVVDHPHEPDADDPDAHGFHKLLAGLTLWLSIVSMISDGMP
jgi:hypothetical protein